MSIQVVADRSVCCPFAHFTNDYHVKLASCQFHFTEAVAVPVERENKPLSHQAAFGEELPGVTLNLFAGCDLGIRSAT